MYLSTLITSKESHVLLLRARSVWETIVNAKCAYYSFSSTSRKSRAPVKCRAWVVARYYLEIIANHKDIIEKTNSAIDEIIKTATTKAINKAETEGTIAETIAETEGTIAETIAETEGTIAETIAETEDTTIKLMKGRLITRVPQIPLPLFLFLAPILQLELALILEDEVWATVLRCLMASLMGRPATDWVELDDFSSCKLPPDGLVESICKNFLHRLNVDKAGAGFLKKEYEKWSGQIGKSQTGYTIGIVSLRLIRYSTTTESTIKPWSSYSYRW
jgi:hypothetical protein